MNNQASLTLNQRLQAAIVHHPHLCSSSSKIHFRAKDGTVSIEGTTQTFYDKQLAQELLRNVKGVRKIENNLQVTQA